VSARETLIEQVKLVEDNYGPTEGFNPETLVDAYAHELAEKIRAERYIHDCCPECHAAADACANLIDPEVSDSGA
jgi:hypothetical protein